MKPNRTLGNVAIVIVAALLFGGFVFLATKGGDKKNKVATVASTTTSSTESTTTTTVPETTTTTAAPETTTTPPATTPTTARRATVTTQRPRTTTTVFSCPVRGAQSTEHTDDSASFTHGQDGSLTFGSTGGPAANDTIPFTIQTSSGNGVSGDVASVKFTVELTNNSSNHCIYFAGDNANFVVTLTPQGGAPITFTIGGGTQAPLQPHESLKASQTRDVFGFGTFDATATVDINYG